jgi:hypothetical protein
VKILGYSIQRILNSALGYFALKYPKWTKVLIHGLVILLLSSFFIFVILGYDLALENLGIEIITLIVSFIFVPSVVFVWGLIKAPFELIGELQKYEYTETKFGLKYTIANDRELDYVMLTVKNEGKAAIKSFIGHLLEINSATTNLHHTSTHDLYWFFSPTQIHLGNKDLAALEERNFLVLKANSHKIPEDYEQRSPAHRKFRIYGSGEVIANIDFLPDIYFVKIVFRGVLEDGSKDYRCEASIICKTDFSTNVFPEMEIVKIKEQKIIANPYSAG